MKELSAVEQVRNELCNMPGQANSHRALQEGRSCEISAKRNTVDVL